MLKLGTNVVCLILLLTAFGLAQDNGIDTVNSATQVSAHMEGEGLSRQAVIHWKLSADDGRGDNNVTGYVILRGPSAVGPFEEVGRVNAGDSLFMDRPAVFDSLAANDTLTLPDLPAPPTNVTARDHDNDHGFTIDVLWDPSADENGGSGEVIGYEIYRADSIPELFLYRGTVFKGESSYTDIGDMEEWQDDYMPNNYDYYYKVRAITNQFYPGTDNLFYVIRTVTADPDNFREHATVRCHNSLYTDSEQVGPVQCYGQWFNDGLLAVLVCVVIFFILTIYFISKARKGADLYVRRLPGIEAVDEAIGRATEMGKPILYVLGLGTASDIATIASYTILGRVAKKVAEYQTGLIVPCYDPIVMTVAQETVKTAYMDAGRPDAYDEDMVYFVTNQQFAYVAGVNGVMLRELPATNLYMGKFYAESLILAETGAVAGSIQIAGTDEISQIPFFVVACDYTLIGEELYAASAYLGKEPLLLGTLKAQDYAKAGIIVLMLIGFITMTFGFTGFREFFDIVN